MASQNASAQTFRPLARMQVQAVTSTSATYMLNYKEKKERVLRIAAEGTEGIFILFGRGATVAASATVADVMMLEQTVEAFTIDADVDRISVFSTGASGTTIYTTIGEGL